MRRLHNTKDERGVALVVVIMALAVVTAFVVEFTYSVYVDMNLLNNWREGRRLAALASSGASLAAGFISMNINKQKYTYPGSVALPPQDVFDDGTSLAVSLEDENGKFNLNTIVKPNGEIDEARYEGFRRMLVELEISTDLADAVTDWLDEDSIPMVPGSEDGARNGPMASVDELLLVPGMDRKAYDTVKPYVTVFGSKQININAADPLVIMTMSDLIDRGMAERVVAYRQATPFETVGTLFKVAGFENLGQELTGKYTVKATAFLILTTATSEDGLSRTVECVIEGSGLVKYWKEI